MWAWTRLVAGAVMTVLAVIGFAANVRATAEDYLPYEGTVETAEFWYGSPHATRPTGPARLAQLTPAQLWIKLAEDRAYFVLLTPDNQDKTVQQALHTGDRITLRFDHRQYLGAYPIRELLRDEQVLYSIEDDHRGTRIAAVGVGAAGLLLAATGLTGLRRRRRGSAISAEH